MQQLIKFPTLRRSATALALGLSILATSPARAQTAAMKKAAAIMPPQVGVYRMKVGAFRVTALSDGTIPIKLHDLLTHVKPGQIDKALQHDNLADPVETSVNAYLIEMGSRLVLVDTGAGDLYGPTLGYLPNSLHAAGFRPEQITDVLITHIHTDHSGGLLYAKTLAFPNATLHIAKREVDFWLDPKNPAKTPREQKRFAEAREKVGPYVRAGKVKTFSGDTQLFPGMRALAAPGHTPGHTFYALESQGQKIMFWGDAMHAASLQFPDPDVTIVFDIDSPKAAATRKKFMRDAAQKGYWVAFDHVSFPGVGHIRPEGKGYRWVPINYSDDGHGQ
ncbi:MBL fold metallo-hydrolase [bacterium]|nr:MAG: MBL fold metallo-hydrolase [bacterium]